MAKTPWLRKSKSLFYCKKHSYCKEPNTYDTKYCPDTVDKWWERKNCVFNELEQTRCRICEDYFHRDCSGKHKILLNTDDVVVVSANLVRSFDYGSMDYDAIAVFDKQSVKFWVAYGPWSHDLRQEWMKRTLKHIKDLGFNAKKDILSGEDGS